MGGLSLTDDWLSTVILADWNFGTEIDSKLRIFDENRVTQGFLYYMKFLLA